MFLPCTRPPWPVSYTHLDVKTHHYIISFDPKDAVENDLTMERAQARQYYLNTLYEKYRDVLSESAENEVKLNAAKAKVEKSNAGMVTSYDKLLALSLIHI